ncbi:hypothetical protein DY218_11095 [Streptomyces triticagri]|uniref:Uncharacterized protein n=1 Tax=Streptomyces triticagri TaxID=2293568 RepID=A0A372M6W6_9ACTN|nr:hypothetical protein [Streptomyces triticagri]RFU86676.1 hypothetical protein DY218_11095 [Streptomyces triticagri]
MQIQRGYFIALVALPLVLATIFGLILWEQSRLDRDELGEVSRDAVDRMESAHYAGSLPKDIQAAVDSAVESAAQRKSVPVPFTPSAGFSTDPGDDSLRTYYFHLTGDEDWHVSNGNADDVVCLTLTPAEEAPRSGTGLFEPKLKDGMCPDN